MARSYAPLMTTIWADEDFTALTPEAQRVYLLALSQPNITYCGVVAFTAKRWARMAAGTTVASIEEAVAELERASFVVVDDDTEELFVRSFVRHNGVLTQPQLTKAMVRGYEEILSPKLRDAFLNALPEDLPKACDSLAEARARADGRVREGCPAGTGQDLNPEPESLTLDPDLNSSSSSVTPTGAAEPDDDEDEEVWQRLARVKFESRPPLSSNPVTDRNAWLAKVAATDSRDCELRGLLAGARRAWPDATIGELARYLHDGTEPAKAPTGRMHHCGAGPFIGMDAYADHLEGCEAEHPAFSDLPTLDDCPSTAEYATEFGEVGA